MAHDRPPKILQIFREPLKPGREAEYKTIEDDTARACAELGCPHPHLAMEPLSGPREVWWLNAFASDDERRRVEEDYAKNRALMRALERNSERKADFTGTPINLYASYRSGAWNLAGARFLVVATTRKDIAARGSVFETTDGVRFVFLSVRTREEADSEATAFGLEGRVFAIRPCWGLPAKEWIAADPEFWSANPAVDAK